MISCQIPGRDTLEIFHLVCDVNGTLTQDGILMRGVAATFEKLKDHVSIHLVSADTYGRLSELESALAGSVHKFIRLTAGSEAEQKLEYLEALEGGVAAIGQGTNDRLMIKEADLGICVMSPEGSAVETLLNADIVVPDILTALELLLNPTRLKATLRQ